MYSSKNKEIKTLVKAQFLQMLYYHSYQIKSMNIRSPYQHMDNVNAPVVATTSWWLHFSAQVVA